MTTPLPVLPQIIVEAGLVPGSPGQASTALRLDDVTFGKLDTGTLGSGTTWTDISQWVRAFTITRPSTRLAGPLWNYQASTATITLDNSDGRFDPDNLSGPYVSAGVTQLAAMVPVRIRAAFMSVAYPLWSGFADGWILATVDYEGGYAELTLSATDAFRVLAGIFLAPVAAEGSGADTGARITDILGRAGWYTSAEYRAVNTGNSTLQATTLGDYALNLMQIAADSEIGQLYVNGSGAVVFRNRRALLNDARSNKSQANFGDLPVSQSWPFDVSLGDWVAASNCAISLTPGSMTMTSSAAGAMKAASCATGSVLTLGLACGPKALVTGSIQFQAATVARFCGAQADFYDSSGTLLFSTLGVQVQDTTTGWTQLTVSAVSPAGTAACILSAVVQGTGGAGEVHYASNAVLSVAELPYATVGRASDDTTIANDIEATRLGGTLQEVQDAASIAKYLFPRTYQRSDLIVQDDATALQWAQWVLYVSRTGEDRFESLTIDPLADPVNLWPQVLGRDTGDRITVTSRPAGTSSPVIKDCFIAGITHTWDSPSRTWLTTWTLQDAAKYGSFLTLDNFTLGMLGFNALAY